MHRLALLLCTLFMSGGLAAQSVAFARLALDTAPGATAPDFADANDGSLYVSWIEPTADGHALRFAAFDRETDAWSAPRPIAQGSGWFINGADTPTLAAGLRGKLAAVWYERDPAGGHGYHARYATSEDHGGTWTAPANVSTESAVTEFVTLAPLINGRWLAIWLDGRARGDGDGHGHGGAMQLRSRSLGSEEPDTLIDDRVCDCCNLAASVLPNGAVLLAYRDRGDDETRDFSFKRYSRGAWQDAPAPAGDGWVINACPVNGAHLARRGAHVAAAWFTAAQDQPRVMTARSHDIGNSWNLVGAVSDDSARPVGRAAVAVTRDGSQWISWVEADGTLALRQLDADGELQAIARLPLSDPAAAGPHERPRLTVLDDRSGTPARLLVARPEAGHVTTYLATLPATDGALVDDCGCGPGEAASRGHPVRGHIERVMADRQALLVNHEEVPGVMRAMTMMFQVDPRVIPLVSEGQSILARMERRDDGKWWLFDIRLLEARP